MVQNSLVNLTETNRGSFPLGTVLQYSCDPGYLADGPSIITCTPLNLWTSDPPRCIRSDGTNGFTKYSEFIPNTLNIFLSLKFGLCAH